MKKTYIFRMMTMLCILGLLITCVFVAKAEDTSQFILTTEEQAYLDSLRERPITISYSYDLVVYEYDGRSYSLITPILDVLEKEFGLTVELIKNNWHDAFVQVENGEVDFYGPIAISEARRQKYLTVDPFYRSYSKIVSRVSEPVNSMSGLFNRSIGLLEGSVISRTMQAYLGPEGSTIYFSTMEAMIEGLQSGLIDAFATVDNAELELLNNDDIRLEFSIDNFYVDQGFISGKEELRPLVTLLNRYISENTQIKDRVTALRNEALLQYMRERFAEEIAYLQANCDKIPMFAEAILYPLCYEENGVLKGMQPEINEIFEELTGIPIYYISPNDFLDGVDSAKELLKKGTCLAAVGAYYNMDIWNDPSFTFSPILWMDTIRTYARYDSHSELAGKIIGTTPLATDYLGWNNTTGNTPVIDGSREKLLSYLKNGKLDALFMSEMTFNYEYFIKKDYSLREVTGLTAEASMLMMYGAQNKEFNTLYNESMNLYHILNPTALREWRVKSDKYQSEYIRMRYMQQIWLLVVIIVFSAMVLVIILLMMKNLRQNKNTIALMKILNEKDALTGIYNRRYLDENLEKTIPLLSRSMSAITVFMIDIDHFKRFNDMYGHGKGDECIKLVANTLDTCLQRKDDFVARYGGEEFAVVLPHTDEAGARIIADKMFEAIKSLNIPHAGNKVADRVSISMGIATSTAEHTQTGMDYLNRADQALYISKQSGRNKYTFSSSDWT